MKKIGSGMFKHLSIKLRYRIVALAICVVTLAGLCFASTSLAGYMNPGPFTLSWGEVTGINWATMHGPSDYKIGTFCTHPKMSGGGQSTYIMWYNDSDLPNTELNSIISASGMNAQYLQEMRYIATFGYTNSLMDAQNIYWYYLYMRRPDLFDNFGNFTPTAAQQDLWFNSDIGSYPVGVNVTESRGLKIGDECYPRILYNGSAYTGTQLSGLTTNDVIGPFKVDWNKNSSFSPVLAQLNYGADKRTPPTFELSDTNLRVYSTANATGAPSRTAAMGEDFYIKYTGPTMTSGQVLSFNIESSSPITTKFLGDRFFYSYNLQYQYTVDLEKQSPKFTVTSKFKGEEPPPPEEEPRTPPTVDKYVTQDNGINNQGDYVDLMEVPTGTNALHKMTVTNKDAKGTYFKFGQRDLDLTAGYPGVVEVSTLAEFKTAVSNDNKILLKNDITIPAVWTPMNFDGIIDGDGHKIINNSTVAVFASTTGAGFYRVEFNFPKKTLSSTANAAFIETLDAGSEIRDCKADISLTVSRSISTVTRIGGLVGRCTNSSINGLDAKCVIDASGVTDLGGVLGYARDSSFYDNSLVKGSSIKANGTFTGGFVGYAYICGFYNHNIEVDFTTQTDFLQADTNFSGFAGLGGESSFTKITTKGTMDTPSSRPVNFNGLLVGSTANNIRIDRCDSDFSSMPINIGTYAAGIMRGEFAFIKNSHAKVNFATVSSSGAQNNPKLAGIVHSDKVITGAYVENCYTEGWIKTQIFNGSRGYDAAGILNTGVSTVSNIDVRNCYSTIDFNFYANGSYVWGGIVNIMGYYDDQRTITPNTKIKGCLFLGKWYSTANEDRVGWSGVYGVITNKYVTAPNTTYNYQNFDSNPPVVAGGNGTRHGTYVSSDANFRGNNAVTTLSGSSYNSWSISNTDTTKVWKAGTNALPTFNDCGYEVRNIVYVHDYYQNNYIKANDLLVYENNTFKPAKNSSFATAAETAVTGEDCFDVFIKNLNGTFTFYYKVSNLQPGTYHNVIKITPRKGFNWPGEEDDDWVIVKDKKAKLDVIKMLYDNGYMTTVDGCTFQLRKYNSLNFTNEDVAARETIEPKTMFGTAFAQYILPQCTYIVEEIATPAYLSSNVGRKWYVRYVGGRIHVYNNAAMTDEIDQSAIGETRIDNVTTLYSYKVVNTPNTDTPRKRLRVIKYNEDGTAVIDGSQVFENGLPRWTGAMYSVMKCDTSDFTGGKQAYGYTLICNDPNSNYIDLPNGYYVVSELQAPDGYVLDTTEYWVTVTDTDITIIDRHVPNIDQVGYINGVQDLRATIETSSTSGSTTIASKGTQTPPSKPATVLNTSTMLEGNEVDFAIELKNRSTGEKYIGHCLDIDNPGPDGDLSASASVAPKSEYVLASALSRPETSITLEEFNQLFGFTGNPNPAAFTSDKARNAFMACVIWGYTDGEPYSTFNDWLHNEGYSYITSSHWTRARAVLTELLNKYVSSDTAKPSYDVKYNSLSSTTGELEFYNVNLGGLSAIKPKFKIEWTTPGVTVKNGSTTLASGSIVELTTGLKLSVTGPANSDLAFKLTDTVRYPKFSSLYGIIYDFGSGMQPILYASLEAEPVNIKDVTYTTKGLANVVLKTKNKQPEYFFRIHKINGKTNGDVAGAKFSIQGVSPTVYAKQDFLTDGNGIIDFTLPRTNGTYRIWESAPAPGYDGVTDEYIIRTLNGDMYVTYKQGATVIYDEVLVRSTGHILVKIPAGGYKIVEPGDPDFPDTLFRY